MEEKIICESIKRRSSILLIRNIMIMFGFILWLIIFAALYKFVEAEYSLPFLEKPSLFKILLIVLSISIPLALPIVGFPVILAIIFTSAVGGYCMTVTDKRIYGKLMFNKRVDISLDQVSSISTIGNYGIKITTPARRASFLFLANRKDLYQCISEMLIQRQNEAKANSSPLPQPPLTNADELKKYKELLDAGAITLEEFDAKKKQLLNL